MTRWVSWHHADRGDQGGRTFRYRWRAWVDQMLYPKRQRAGITRERL